ncbi:MAG: phosphatase PAP2 family protein [Chloroflexota bacterium]|nr:phosphatase PAP2 family protein [Chloroflexota bacterium]
MAIAIFIGAELTNRSFLAWGLLACFAVMVVPTGRFRSLLFSFGPYAGTWFIFTALRSLADETPLARSLNLYAPDFERELFRGQLPTITLQDALFDPNNMHWYDYFCTAIHWSYFIVPHAMAIYLWMKKPAIFRQMLGGMILLLGMGLAIYFLIPSNPPWMAPEPINSPSAPVVYRAMETIGKELGGGMYEASYRVIGESNPRAAMPSIHMAITFLLAFPAWAVNRRFGIGMFTYSMAMGFSLMYLGEHYFIDLLVGCLVAAYGWYGFPHIVRLVDAARVARVRSKATIDRAGESSPQVATPSSASV